MPRPGWIKLHHAILDNPIWNQTPFSEGQAWVDLLLLTENEEKDFSIDGKMIHQMPGNVYMAKKALMERWGWSRRKLDGAFKRWESQNMIKVSQVPLVHQNEHQNVHRTYTVVTIVKWRFFQGGKPKGEHQNVHQNELHLKNNIKKGGDGGSSPRPAGEVEVVKINGEWVARQK